MNNTILYTGEAWKHHEYKDCDGTTTGAAKGGTIFTNYDKMLEYLTTVEKERKWTVAKIELNDDPIHYEFDNDYMATLLVDKLYDEKPRLLEIYK